MVRALAITALVAGQARAQDMCASGAKHHGAPIDLDVKDADIHDVLRLLADVGHVNLVVSDEVAGKVTVKLKRVAWDLAACTIARVHHLSMIVHDTVILVRKA
jgi:type IV pilus assembly protein PilQ